MCYVCTEMACTLHRLLLVLFAAQATPVPTAAGRKCDVTEFGAKGDGKRVVASINEALAHCEHIVFKQGKFVTGTISCSAIASWRFKRVQRSCSSDGRKPLWHPSSK